MGVSPAFIAGGEVQKSTGLMSRRDTTQVNKSVYRLRIGVTLTLFLTLTINLPISNQNPNWPMLCRHIWPTERWYTDALTSIPVCVIFLSGRTSSPQATKTSTRIRSHCARRRLWVKCGPAGMQFRTTETNPKTNHNPNPNPTDPTKPYHLTIYVDASACPHPRRPAFTICQWRTSLCGTGRQGRCDKVFLHRRFHSRHHHKTWLYVRDNK